MARIHELILKKIKNIKSCTIINCGYGKGTSVLEVINKFISASKKNFLVKIEKKRSKEISSIYADNSYLIKKLKWKPKFNNIDLSIKSCLKWEKKIKSIENKK